MKNEKDTRIAYIVKTHPGVFVGFHEQQNAYKVLLNDTLDLVVSRDVTLNEFSFANVASIRSKISELDSRDLIFV